MIKLIIFDFSGVCFNGEEEPYIKQFCKKRSIDFEEFSKKYYELACKAEKDELSGKRVWNILSKEFEFKEDPDKIIKEMMKGKIKYQDMLDLAGKLRSNYKTAYYTNYSKDYWIYIPKRFNLKPYFDFGIVSYQVKSRKPEAKGFHIILDHFYAKPKEAVFIDDSEKNVKAAAKIGINTIHLTDRKRIKEELKSKGVSI